MKNGILWLLIAAFLASVIFLFLANSQKNAAIVSLNESKQQAEDLQTQLNQIKSSNADSQSAEVSRLRADNQDLPRLRNEVTQLQDASQKLQAANDKLTQQLQAILTTAQEQQAQLEKDAVERQQARVAAAQADAQAAQKTCINNLRQIDAAKNEWQLENNKPDGAVPTEQDVVQYLKNNVLPTCPSGGTYTLNAVGVPPTCSIPGHVLP
jgi:DNA repair exonuclease SbcCD ATPase subunit